MRQAFIHRERPDSEHIKTIRNWEQHELVTDNDLYKKPCGGIWTSPVTADYGWKQFCQDNEWYDDLNAYHLIPEDDVNVYTLDTVDDLSNLIEEHGREGIDCIDFESAFTEYDGIYLSDEGETNTRHSTPNLRGWDVASVVWDDWHFEEVRKV